MIGNTSVKIYGLVNYLNCSKRKWHFFKEWIHS